MDYISLLETSYEKYSSLVCMGLDPVIENIPEVKGSIKERIFIFYENILNACIRNNIFPSAVKPNYAFYAQYGMEGIQSLVELCTLFRLSGIPLILDVKRGDIGTTARAYAREAFEFFNADAVTLSPFLGIDSIEPFMTGYPEKGYYILNRTSNSSAGEIQDITIEGEPLYTFISKKIIEWYRPGIGAVVGATFPAQLHEIVSIFDGSSRPVPLLIPGIGSQGGDIHAILSILKSSSSFKLARINASSSINYAYKNNPGVPYADAAVHELDRLNGTIGSCYI